MDYALVLARAVHIGATVLLSGIVFFETVIVEPAMRRSAWQALEPRLRGVRRQIGVTFWASLVIALIAGGAWFLVVVEQISDRPPFDIFADETAGIVLTQTQFGQDWAARLVLMILIAVMRPIRSSRAGTPWRGSLKCGVAAGLLGTLALVGHAGATQGVRGTVHLAADILHLLAAGAWVGGLVPFALMFRAVRRDGGEAVQSFISVATRRFSMLGVFAVSALAGSGLVNAWMLVGSPTALVETDYGRLLLLKLAIFLAMIAIASFNRLRLSPHLPDTRAIAALERNSLVEVGLGACVIGIVGALGTLPPAL